MVDLGRAGDGGTKTSLPNGLDLHLQAVVLHGGTAADLRFSNALSERVRVF